jgi:hypothetical protein
MSNFDNINVEVLLETSNIIDYIKQNTFDTIVLNFGSFNNNNLLDKILLLNPKQRIVVISTDSKCTDSISCQHCKESYSKVRLIPPFKTTNLIEYIINDKILECPHFRYCEEYKFMI